MDFEDFLDCSCRFTIQALFYISISRNTIKKTDRNPTNPIYFLHISYNNKKAFAFRYLIVDKYPFYILILPVYIFMFPESTCKVSS